MGNIEQEIQQKRFESEHQRAIINIMYTNNWLVNQMKPMLKPFGITHQQYNVLRILNGKYPQACSSTAIKKVMLDKTPDLTRLIDRLLQKELVSRKVCPANRRKLDISITAKGRELLSHIRPELQKYFDQFLRITSDEASELSRILDKLRG